MKGTTENKSLELSKYDKNYNSFMLLSKILWTIFTGVIAIITLGESSFYRDFIWNYTTICIATIAVIYTTMFNTPEKLKTSSKDLKDNKFLLGFSLVVVVIVILIFIFFKREFSLPVAVIGYLLFILISLYGVIGLDKHFSKE